MKEAPDRVERSPGLWTDGQTIAHDRWSRQSDDRTVERRVALAGLTLVAVNPAYQARELRYVLEQSRSEAIYYVSEFRGNPMGEGTVALSDRAARGGVRRATFGLIGPFRSRN